MQGDTDIGCQQYWDASTYIAAVELYLSCAALANKHKLPRALTYTRTKNSHACCLRAVTCPVLVELFV